MEDSYCYNHMKSSPCRNCELETQAAELSEAKSSLEVLTKCECEWVKHDGLICQGCKNAEKIKALDKREG